MRSIKRSMVRKILLLSTVLVFLVVSISYGQQRWWERRDEGWFFYNEKKKETLELPPEPKKEEEKKKEIESSSSKESESDTYIEKMRKIGDILLSKALEQPTVENIRAYLEWNTEMMKRAELFTVAWQKTLQLYPQFASDTPMTDSLKDVYFKVKDNERKNIIDNFAIKEVIFFFYTSSCPYCQKQAEVLLSFKKAHPNVIIKPISVDGGVLPEFPDTVMDNGISEKLGITMYPALYAAYPLEDRFERLSYGLFSLREIEDAIIWYEKYEEAQKNGSVE
jgi:conjugal transfer pilus assembly protein TraF